MVVIVLISTSLDFTRRPCDRVRRLIAMAGWWGPSTIVSSSRTRAHTDFRPLIAACHRQLDQTVGLDGHHHTSLG